jgi:uncharacterized membrane protein YidH (DUF202 family)
MPSSLVIFAVVWDYIVAIAATYFYLRMKKTGFRTEARRKMVFCCIVAVWVIVVLVSVLALMAK